MANPSSHSARTVAALTDVALEGLPPHEDGMERLKRWLDAVSELAEAVRAAGHGSGYGYKACPLCDALGRYDDANAARNA